MGLTYSILVLAACVAASFFYWIEYSRDDAERQRVRKWLITWAVKGVGVPLLVWMLFNSGLIARLPSLMTELEIARAGKGSAFPVFLRVTGAGMCFIGTFWAAITLSWLAVTIPSRIPAERRAEFFGQAILWGCVMSPVAGLILYAGGLRGVGFAVVIWVMPIIHTTLPLMGEVTKHQPIYTGAIAKLKFGKYAEAESEVIHQLEACENDFDGWMMLADLYANHFNDLIGAEQTIRDLCEHPTTHPSQMAVAFHRLADWHLKLADNPVAAREALEDICRRVPDTHLDRMARLRIRQLPLSRDELRDQKLPRKIRLPSLGDRFDQPAESAPEPADVNDAAARAKRCVDRLRENPDNATVREEFAVLLAEQLGRVEDGMQQVKLLIAMPGQSPEKVAEWIGLMASWELKHSRNEPEARRLLECIVNNYPGTSQAGAARRHLALLDTEQRLRAARAAAAAKPRTVIRIDPVG